jgi:DNA-binding NarL/FixJ family response regulator
MMPWQWLRRVFSYQQPEVVFCFETEIVEALREMAARQQCSESELAADLLTFAIAQRKIADENLACWRVLSPREQEVAAFVCLGDTNRQIAARLRLSLETIKTHVRNILRKLNLASKDELRRAFSEWDFSLWNETGCL